METPRSEILRQRLKRFGVTLRRGLYEQRTCWILEKEDPNLHCSWEVPESNLDNVENFVQKLEQLARP